MSRLEGLYMRDIGISPFVISYPKLKYLKLKHLNEFQCTVLHLTTLLKQNPTLRYVSVDSIRIGTLPLSAQPLVVDLPYLDSLDLSLDPAVLGAILPGLRMPVLKKCNVSGITNPPPGEASEEASEEFLHSLHRVVSIDAWNRHPLEVVAFSVVPHTFESAWVCKGVTVQHFDNDRRNNHHISGQFFGDILLERVLECLMDIYGASRLKSASCHIEFKNTPTPANCNLYEILHEQLPHAQVIRDTRGLDSTPLTAEWLSFLTRKETTPSGILVWPFRHLEKLELSIEAAGDLTLLEDWVYERYKSDTTGTPLQRLGLRRLPGAARNSAPVINIASIIGSEVITFDDEPFLDIPTCWGSSDDIAIWFDLPVGGPA